MSAVDPFIGVEHSDILEAISISGHLGNCKIWILL